MSLINHQKPLLILDEHRCRNNINKMADKAESVDCIFRPHFKTHQSIEIGTWFKEAGVNGITVSSTGMADYFASAGWKDITIAFPFFKNQLPELAELEKQTRLRLFVNTPEDLELLDKELINPIEFVIEIDPGYGRSGIHYKNTDMMNQLIKKADELGNVGFHGFYVHEGRTYQAHGKKEIVETIQPVIHILENLKKTFPQASLSLGDTPSASVLDEFGDIDELTPGNFVFYDWMQVNIGSCVLDDVALYAVLPTAQRFADQNRAIVHGGAAHLSKEFLAVDGKKNFGQMISYSPSKIVAADGAFLSALSQEHGTLAGLPDSFRDEEAWICPIHSCLTANLHDYYCTTEGRLIEKRILS